MKLKVGDGVIILYKGVRSMGEEAVVLSCSEDGYIVILAKDILTSLGPFRNHELEFVAEGYDHIIEQRTAEIDRLQNILKTNNSIIERAMSTINPNFNDLIIKNDKP